MAEGRHFRPCSETFIYAYAARLYAYAARVVAATRDQRFRARHRVFLITSSPNVAHPLTMPVRGCMRALMLDESRKVPVVTFAGSFCERMWHPTNVIANKDGSDVEREAKGRGDDCSRRHGGCTQPRVC